MSKSLCCFVLVHAINLHQRCSTCVLYGLIAVTNIELQAWFRIRRLGTSGKAVFYRFCSLSTSDQWCETIQRAKFREEILAWPSPATNEDPGRTEAGFRSGLLQRRICEYLHGKSDRSHMVCHHGQSEIRLWKGVRFPDRLVFGQATVFEGVCHSRNANSYAIA